MQLDAGMVRSCCLQELHGDQQVKGIKWEVVEVQGLIEYAVNIFGKLNGASGRVDGDAALPL